MRAISPPSEPLTEAPPTTILPLKVASRPAPARRRVSTRLSVALSPAGEVPKIMSERPVVQCSAKMWESGVFRLFLKSMKEVVVETPLSLPF